MADGVRARSAAGAARRRSGLAYFLVRLWREKPLGTAGGVVLLALILVAIFADVLAPYPFDEVHLRDLLKPPSAEHLMGSDQLGRDFLSRNIHGARVFHVRRPARDQPQRPRCGADRRHGRILRWQAGSGGATVCRRLDGVSGSAVVADDHVAGRTGFAAAHPGAGHHRRRGGLEAGPRRRDRGQGERLLAGGHGHRQHQNGSWSDMFCNQPTPIAPVCAT